MASKAIRQAVTRDNVLFTYAQAGYRLTEDCSKCGGVLLYAYHMDHGYAQCQGQECRASYPIALTVTA